MRAHGGSAVQPFMNQMVITKPIATWLCLAILKVQTPSSSMIGIVITNLGRIIANPQKAARIMVDTTGAVVHHRHQHLNQDLVRCQSHARDRPSRDMVDGNLPKCQPLTLLTRASSQRAKKAGMKVPCAGSDSCRYTNKAQCVVTSEVGCGNPMMTTAKQSGCTYPRGCPAFKNVYTYMGSKWVTKDGQKAGCGTDGSRWCTQGSPKKAGYAFCAKSTSKSKQKKNGDELGSHGGWTFYKVPTKDTSDAGTMKACKDAGLEVPCAGAPGCHYNNKAKECVQTSEKGCGNPMSTTSKSVCKGKWPRDCKAFDNTYTFMGKVWAGGGSCGTKGGSWCTVGKKNSAGFAFCAQQTR